MKLAQSNKYALIALTGFLLLLRLEGKASHASYLSYSRPLSEILEEISQKYHVFFTYDADLIGDIKVDFDLSNTATFEKVVNQLMDLTGLGYEHLGDKYYVIYRKDKKGVRTMKKMKRKIRQIQKLEHSGSLSLVKKQEQPERNLEKINSAIQKLNKAKRISGSVKDEFGEFLMGVNILVKETGRGTITNEDGIFKLDVPLPGQTLIFSYTGFSSQEIPIPSSASLQIILKQSAIQMSEVVVTGYGSQNRDDVTGSIASIDMGSVESLPLTSVEQSLQGRVAGVQVIQTGGGAPGGSMQVNIRGIGTINGETPLYVIDGIPVQEKGQNDQGYSFLNNLNPNDIASIDILKDASASAIYGSRASGGVILIKTHRGREGPIKIKLDHYYGIQFRGKLYEVLNASQYVDYLNELHSQPDGLLPPAFSDGRTPRAVDTDWQKSLFQPSAPIQNHTLSISGGNKKSSFSLGLEHFDHKGIIIGSKFNRYSIRANSDFKIGDRIKVKETLLLSRTNKSSVQHRGGRRSQEHAIKQSPFVRIFDDSFLGGFGHPDIGEGQDASNPVADQIFFEDAQERFQGWFALTAELSLLRHLDYKILLGLDFTNEDFVKYNPEFEGIRRLMENSFLFRIKGQQFNPILEQFLTYSNQWELHDLSLLMGFSAQSFQISQIGGRGNDIPKQAVSLANSGSNLELFDFNEQTALRSIFSRLTYSFAKKFLLTANVRRDESSKLSRSTNPIGIFPSISMGWIVSNEPFFDKFSFVDKLKIRAGIGKVGNQTPLSAYPVDNRLSSDFYYVFGGQAVQGVGQIDQANDAISWEISSQIDLGLDLALFNNSLLINFDYYQRVTKDLIWPQQVPASVGLGPAFVNAGVMENKGIELAIAYRKSKGAFTFDIGGNITTINNQIKSLINDELIIKRGNPSDDLTAVSWSRVGGGIGDFYGFVSDGLFRNWEEVYNHAYINQATTGSIASNGVPIYDLTERDEFTALTHTAPGDIRWRDVNEDGIVNELDKVFLGSPIPKLIYGFNFDGQYKGLDFQIFLQGVYGNKLFNSATRWLSDNRQNFNVGVQALDATAYRSNYIASNPRLVRSDPNKNILRVSDRYIFDGSYLRIKNVTIGYSFNEKLRNKLKANKMRVYLTAQNLATFTKYIGLEPEIGSFESGTGLDSGIDRLLYPQPTSVIMGFQFEFQ